jgi:two-component system response regulator HydG
VQLFLLIDAYLGGARMAGEENPVFAGEAAPLPAATKSSFHGLIGAGAAMRRLYRRIEAAAATTGNLLLVGESGTGKELVAHAVHKCSARAGRPFVALNCAALPKDLIESELFGYKRGAFSGASNEYPGLFRAADRGTLFLDEITEMSAETQSKLLRAIQERAIRPLGSTVEQPVNVRLIASSNRDLRAAVACGRLREDLYYRMQAAVLTIPPLRERREDIPLLVEHFIGLFNQTVGRTMEGIQPGALDSMVEYDWPGNVRELSNALEGAFTFGAGRLIGLEDLPAAVTGCGDGQFDSELGYPGGCAKDASVTTFAEAERDVIARALQSSGGNKVRAAEQLKISRKKLYAGIAKYCLSAM